MPERIQFHLDENVNSAVAAALRLVGADVSTTASVGLLGTSDLEQLAFVQAERRVLVTHDADFLVIASERQDHPGIAFCQKDRRSIGEVVGQLVLMYEVLEPGEMVGRVEYL